MMSSEEKDPSESSGIADILEIAAKIESSDDEPKPKPVAVAPRPPVAPASQAPTPPKPAPRAEPPTRVPPPIAAEPAPIPAPVAETTSERRGISPLVWVVAGAALALAGLGFAVLRGSNDNGTAQAVQAATAAPSPTESETRPQPRPEPTPPPEPIAVPEADQPEEVEEVEAVEQVVDDSEDTEDVTIDDEAEDDEPSEQARPVKRLRAKPVPRPRKPAAVETSSKPEAKTATPDPFASSSSKAAKPAAPKPDEGKYSSECLLNPNMPGCGGAKKAEEKQQQDLSATLPDKLSQSQIRSGIDAVKGKAKACGTQHGATGVVRVKLSIEGSTGKVSSAQALPPHQGMAVGDCVAQALKGASFPRFKSVSQGTTFPVRL